MNELEADGVAEVARAGLAALMAHQAFVIHSFFAELGDVFVAIVTVAVGIPRAASQGNPPVPSPAAIPQACRRRVRGSGLQDS